MKKASRHIILSVIICMTFSLTACGLWKQAEFDGSKIENADRFEMDFAVLNTTYTYEMAIGKDQYVEVRVTKDKGRLVLSIEDENEDAVYQGDDVSVGEFIVYVDEPGNYIFSVSGERASGKVSFRIEN